MSLIELMVTLIVAAMVAGSTFVFFAGQQRIYETQTQLLNVQQNLWLAMEVMSRQLRAAGTGMTGCMSAGSVPPTGATTPATGLRAWKSGTGVYRIPPLYIKNDDAGGPDEITFAYFTGTSGNYLDGQLTANVPTTYAGTAIHTVDARPFRAGEFVLMFDASTSPTGGDRGCSLLQITSISTNDLLVATTSPWNAGSTVAGFVPFDYTAANAAVRDLGTMTWQRFYIDSTGGPLRPPRLMVDDLTDAAPGQMLADGIEDMQIAYGCDTIPSPNADGELTEGTDPASRNLDEWTYNQSGDVPPATCTLPTAVRVTLIGRSIKAETNQVGASGSGTSSLLFKPATEDGVAGTPDQYRHRLLSTTIFPRN